MHRTDDIPAQTAGDASPAAVPTPAASSDGSPRWVRWLISPAGRALAALVLILLIGCVFHADGSFFKAGTHRDALRQVSVYGILACGLTLVIISGGIDLAVGSVLALVAVAFSMLTIDGGWSAWIAVPAVLLVGALTGAGSGAVTAWGKVQPFIATLAVMVVARGAAKWIPGIGQTKFAQSEWTGGVVDWLFGDVVRSSGSKVMPYFMRDGQFVDATPPMFKVIDSRILGGNVSVVTIIFAFVALLSWVLLSRHRWGRQLYAVGGNEKAAALSGVSVNRVKLWAYVLSGTFAAVAGICQAAQEKQGDPNVGMGYELTAIAIVVIGGTNLMGGRGGIGLTILGTLTIGYLEKILSLNAISEAGRLVLTGLIIVVAVLAQRTRSR